MKNRILKPNEERILISLKNEALRAKQISRRTCICMTNIYKYLKVLEKDKFIYKKGKLWYAN